MIVCYVVSHVVSAEATQGAACGPRSGRQNCGLVLVYYHIWITVSTLDCGGKAAAFPIRCRTQAGSPASIFPYSRGLRTEAVAGQGTRTRTERFDAVLNPALASTLKAPLSATVSLRPSTQVNAALTAGLDQALTAALKSRVYAVLAVTLRPRLDAALSPAFAAQLRCELSP